jgi:hypothetical protein
VAETFLVVCKIQYEDSVLLIANGHSSPHDVNVVSFERENGIAICVCHFSLYLDFTCGCDFSYVREHIILEEMSYSKIIVHSLSLHMGKLQPFYTLRARLRTLTFGHLKQTYSKTFYSRQRRSSIRLFKTQMNIIPANPDHVRDLLPLHRLKLNEDNTKMYMENNV